MKVAIFTVLVAELDVDAVLVVTALVVVSATVEVAVEPVAAASLRARVTQNAG